MCCNPTNGGALSLLATLKQRETEFDTLPCYI
jgi:hypothetical protein